MLYFAAFTLGYCLGTILALRVAGAHRGSQ